MTTICRAVMLTYWVSVPAREDSTPALPEAGEGEECLGA
jgi:hypothetical protein